jgi:hypothetical protein
MRRRSLDSLCTRRERLHEIAERDTRTLVHLRSARGGPIPDCCPPPWRNEPVRKTYLSNRFSLPHEMFGRWKRRREARAPVLATGPGAEAELLRISEGALGAGRKPPAGRKNASVEPVVDPSSRIEFRLSPGSGRLCKEELPPCSPDPWGGPRYLKVELHSLADDGCTI